VGSALTPALRAQQAALYELLSDAHAFVGEWAGAAAARLASSATGARPSAGDASHVNAAVADWLLCGGHTVGAALASSLSGRRALRERRASLAASNGVARVAAGDTAGSASLERERRVAWAVSLTSAHRVAALAADLDSEVRTGVRGVRSYVCGARVLACMCVVCVRAWLACMYVRN
jgi:hypothetical protein